ncbi:hypothetical protein HID58_070086 [Brassica napus]|uniref:Uncharacterized protein n=1 Tax=Brassica napus TaxID=3708 RepID=A0ABQ7YXS0_BRANA|nr:hypothetical protein HID58_070086 [Brassica napus]
MSISAVVDVKPFKTMWKIKVKVIRTTNHPYRIGFLSTTRVRSCEKFPEDLAGFEPVKYTELFDGSLNPDYLVDIIVMTDERLPVVLWGKFACDVSEAMQVREGHSTVLVLRFAKIKVWKGI